MCVLSDVVNDRYLVNVPTGLRSAKKLLHKGYENEQEHELVAAISQVKCEVRFGAAVHCDRDCVGQHHCDKLAVVTRDDDAVACQGMVTIPCSKRPPANTESMPMHKPPRQPRLRAAICEFANAVLAVTLRVAVCSSLARSLARSQVSKELDEQLRLAEVRLKDQPQEQERFRQARDAAGEVVCIAGAFYGASDIGLANKDPDVNS